MSRIWFNMWKNYVYVLSLMLNCFTINAYSTYQQYDCGPYGFICDGANRVRLCDGENIMGPAFICPRDSICNEESTDVCDSTNNYIDPLMTRKIRCHRSERIADPTVENCKGYILCIPNKSRFQGIKFKCSGNTIFNGFTRTCTAPGKYKCPIENTTKVAPETYYQDKNKNRYEGSQGTDINGHRPIECKNYKFAITQDSSPSKPTYFCPSRPVMGENSIRCTIFSNLFCITLERASQDQFIENIGAANRKPRIYF